MIAIIFRIVLITVRCTVAANFLLYVSSIVTFRSIEWPAFLHCCAINSDSLLINCGRHTHPTLLRAYMDFWPTVVLSTLTSFQHVHFVLYADWVFVFCLYNPTLTLADLKTWLSIRLCDPQYA